MTGDRDLDLQLASWLDERAALGVPDGLLARSLARVDATRQRPGWLVWDRRARRVPTLRNTPVLTRFAVAAVIGVVAIGGAFYLLRPSQPAVVGDPDASPSPTVPAPSPTPTSVPLPTPKPDPMSLTGPMGVGRQIHTATTLADGRVLVAGGYDYADLSLASASLYDPSTGTFSSTGPLATARGLHTATLLPDGRVLVAGGGPAGWVIQGAYLASVELYDPRTGTFTDAGSMATPREDHTATLLADGRVLIAGGNDRNGHTVASAELYDPDTGTFSPTGSMVTARGFHTATLLADGRVLITGGHPYAWTAGPALPSAEIYDPETGTFTATGSMADARTWHTATLLDDGRVLVTGGDTGGTQLASSELYDPTSGTFTPTGSMAYGREYHTATLLTDGRVLVAGGGGDYTNRTFLSSAEIYDPESGTFTVTASMADTRTFHGANLLADGRVLVTGGYGALAPLASAELYDPRTGTFSPAGAGD